MTRLARPLHGAAAALAATAALGAGAQAQTRAIDPDTGELTSPALRQADVERRGGACGLAPAGPSDRVVLHGAYEGQALSSATVAGQDAVTTLAEVEIAPGSEPLYLVLSSSTPMIWSLRGATGRVSQVAAVAPSAAAGVVGAPAAKVRVLSSSDCFGGFSKASSPKAAQARALVRRVVGREPAVSARYAVAAVTLPGGTDSTPATADASTRFDPALRQAALRFHPRGLAEVDPRSVQGARAQAYAVLPARMGLAQLVSQGRVQALGGDNYRVTRPIARFPAGLTGAQSVRLALAPGVPIPAGDVGHACVTGDRGRQVVANALICAEALRPEAPGRD